MKKAWKIISTVLVWAVVVIAVAMMIFTIVSVNTFNRNDRALFGYKAFIVLSDSMAATDFDAGDLVLIKEVSPQELKEGDIIAYQSRNSSNFGETVTHKIRALTRTEDGEPGFITYGTTTGVDDETIVTYPFVLGRYEFSIPKLGTFFRFLKTPTGYICCILLPFLLLIIYQGINCVKIFRQYKREEMAELQAEKDAIEAERKRSEAMMAELLAMKEQITAAARPVEPQPVQPEPAVAQPDLEAMMAELAALRAQVAASKKEEPASGQSDKPENE